jgi:tetratricopeptide (TPR) repeat protein
MKENETIKIGKNGNISILIKNEWNTINTEDSNVLELIQNLNVEQIAVINKMTIEQTDMFSETFKSLINKLAKDKNSSYKYMTIRAEKIEDEIYYHFTSQYKIPRYLSDTTPPFETKKYIGRTSELDDLHEALIRNKQVVITGMKGIGKTTLAQMYVNKKGGCFKHIAWISQSSDNYKLDFTKDQVLYNNLGVGKEFINSDEIFNEIYKNLFSINGPLLLIIDNADLSVQKLKNRMPKISSIYTLITSRHELYGFVLRQLDCLEPSKAFLLFKINYKLNIITDNQIEELIKKIEYHTFTIELLARTAEYYKYSFEELLNGIKLDKYTKTYHIEHAINAQYRIESYMRSVFNFIKLETEELWVIKQIVCLPSEYINFKILEYLILKSNNHFDLALILNKLMEKSCLIKNSETDSYKMPQIITEIIKKLIPITFEDIEYLLKTIINELISVSDDECHPIEKIHCMCFLNNVIETIEIQEKNTIDTEKNIAMLLTNMASMLHDIKDYEGEKKLLDKAVKYVEKIYGLEDPLTAECYKNMGINYKLLGFQIGAKKLFIKAIQLSEKHFGTEDHKTGFLYLNLGFLYEELRDFIMAKEFFEKAMTSYEKCFGKGHPDTSIIYSNLAFISKILGNLDLAKELFEKAIKCNEKNFGEKHPLTAFSYANLASVHYRLGDFNLVKILMDKVMNCEDKNFGEESVFIGQLFNDLSQIYEKEGNYDGAIKILEKALKCDIKSHGAIHNYTSENYYSLAINNYKIGNKGEAKELFEKSVKITETIFGKEHKLTALQYYNMASDLYELEDYTMALEFLERSVAIYQKISLPVNKERIDAQQLYEIIKHKVESNNN